MRGMGVVGPNSSDKKWKKQSRMCHLGILYLQVLLKNKSKGNTNNKHWIGNLDLSEQGMEMSMPQPPYMSVNEKIQTCSIHGQWWVTVYNGCICIIYFMLIFMDISSVYANATNYTMIM